jgi:hypothetical protein
MTYSAMTPKVDDDLVSATEWRQIRDNWISGVPETAADVATPVHVDFSWWTLYAYDGRPSGMRWLQYGIYNIVDTGTPPSEPSYYYDTLVGEYLQYDDSGSVDITDNNPLDFPGNVYFMGNSGLYFIYDRMPTLMDFDGAPDTYEVGAKYSALYLFTTPVIDVHHIATSPPELSIFYGARIISLSDTQLFWETGIEYPSDTKWQYLSELTYSRQRALVKMHGGAA